MLLWFFATSITAVSFVFHDPRIDYRVVMLGSIVPDVVDAGFGGARVGHSLSLAVVVLLIVWWPPRTGVAAAPVAGPAHRRCFSIWCSTARGRTRIVLVAVQRVVGRRTPAQRGAGFLVGRYGGRRCGDPRLGLVPLWPERSGATQGVLARGPSRCFGSDVTLVLVRHGRTELNARGLLQGRLDASLDELGQNQAARVVARPVALIACDYQPAASCRRDGRTTRRRACRRPPMDRTRLRQPRRHGDRRRSAIDVDAMAHRPHLHAPRR